MSFTAFFTWLIVSLAPFGVTPTNSSTEACDQTSSKVEKQEASCTNDKSGSESDDDDPMSIWSPILSISNGF